MYHKLLRAAALCALAFVLDAGARAQTPNATMNAEQPAPSAPSGDAPQDKLRGGLFALEDVQRRMREQRDEIEQLRAALKEQSRLIGELRSRVEATERQVAATVRTTPAFVRDAADANAKDASPLSSAESSGTAGAAGTASLTRAAGAAAGALSAADAAQGSKLEDRAARGEGQSKKPGEGQSKNTGEASRQPASLTFSGDLRFRYESIYGQQNALAAAGNPATLGNPLGARQRLRLRARLGVKGRINDEFQWGMRLATGSFADVNSSNQTLTDFFSRKPFALDQAFIAYSPKRLPGFQAQAGKFEPSWTRTEMTWDNDVSPEGLMETYTRNFKKSAFKSFALQAWQLPVLERNGAFVTGADGRVDASATARGSRDLALYGAQARTEFAPWKHASLKLSATDLYWSGTQFINPAQVFGTNIQFPVTVNIPASGTTPARTVTTQVSIPRDLLVTGNANLGLTPANTNAVNRDGRLASGFNMVDLIGQLNLTTPSARLPFMLLFDFVTNTQTHDVVTAGPGGADLLLPNHEGQGYWAEFQLGKDVLRLPVDKIARGDAAFNYTFIRIEKDAVLTPFNFSDIAQPSDVRVHRFIVAYAVDPHVTLSFTSNFTQRPHGLLGAFASTPPGSLNRTTTRLQLDTILRF
jgi:hypothetical protein